MLLNTLLGLIVFSTTNMSLLYTSHLLVRRFIPNAPHSVRLVAIGLLFYAFILLILQCLSPFHAITKIGVVFSCLLMSLFVPMLDKLKAKQTVVRPTPLTGLTKSAEERTKL